MRENDEGRMHIIIVCVNVVRADGTFQKKMTGGNNWEGLVKSILVRTRNTIGEEVCLDFKRMTKKYDK